MAGVGGAEGHRRKGREQDKVRISTRIQHVHGINLSPFLSYRAYFKIDRHDSNLESLIKLGINASSLWQENILLDSQEEDGKLRSCSTFVPPADSAYGIPNQAPPNNYPNEHDYYFISNTDPARSPREPEPDIPACPVPLRLRQPPWDGGAALQPARQLGAVTDGAAVENRQVMNTFLQIDGFWYFLECLISREWLMAFQFGEYRSLNRDERPCLEGAKLGGDLKKYFLRNNPFLAKRHNSKSFIRCIMDKIRIGCIGNGSCSSEALDPLREISARMYGSGGAKVTIVSKSFVLKIFFVQIRRFCPSLAAAPRAASPPTGCRWCHRSTQ